MERETGFEPATSAWELVCDCGDPYANRMGVRKDGLRPHRGSSQRHG